MPDRFSLLSGSDPMNPHFKTLPAAMCLGPGYARLWPGASSLRQVYTPPPKKRYDSPDKLACPSSYLPPLFLPLCLCTHSLCSLSSILHMSASQAFMKGRPSSFQLGAMSFSSELCSDFYVLCQRTTAGKTVYTLTDSFSAFPLVVKTSYLLYEDRGAQN